METPTPTTVQHSVVAYDRRRIYVMLRDWTPELLEADLAARRFGACLAPEEATELSGHLTAWRQRALGVMSLRDTLLIDPRRGRRVFNLLCTALTKGRAAVPDTLATMLPAAPADLAAPPAALTDLATHGALARRASAEGLTLALITAAGDYPFPDDLDGLLPTPLKSSRPELGFEPPRGWRWRIAVLFATAGVALLIFPMMLGTIPDHPAGIPLALLTLALLIGISAGPAGFAGALCIWLIANLPGFRHGSSLLTILWPALPLMALGVALLAIDRRVRGLWHWLRRRLAAHT
jgi:hypothetical protein